jgi:hypothetical protein
MEIKHRSALLDKNAVAVNVLVAVSIAVNIVLMVCQQANAQTLTKTNVVVLNAGIQLMINVELVSMEYFMMINVKKMILILNVAKTDLAETHQTNVQCVRLVG